MTAKNWKGIVNTGTWGKQEEKMSKLLNAVNMFHVGLNKSSDF